MNITPKRMLLLEDDAGDARLLEMMLLQMAPGEYVTQRVERLADAKRLLATDQFDLILTDLGLPDSRGLTTFLQLMVQAPQTPIVVLSSLDDEAVAVKAVHQGAQDYLIKGQVNGTMVARALRYALERRTNRAGELPPARERGKLLTFIGAKGGVGTTTVALNVAASLAAQGKSVIAVELHPGFSTMSLALRITPDEDLLDALELEHQGLDETALASKLVKLSADVRVLFGPQRSTDFHELNPDLVDILLEHLVQMAEFVIVDVPSYPAASTHSAVRASNYTVLVVEREPISVHCGRMQLEVIKPWGASGSRVGALVVSRFPLSAPMKLPEIRTLLGCDLVGIVPPACDECAMTHHAGKTLVEMHPQSLPAHALTEAAHRLSAEHVCGIRVD